VALANKREDTGRSLGSHLCVRSKLRTETRLDVYEGMMIYVYISTISGFDLLIRQQNNESISTGVENSNKVNKECLLFVKLLLCHDKAILGLLRKDAWWGCT